MDEQTKLNELIVKRLNDLMEASQGLTEICTKLCQRIEQIEKEQNELAD